MFISIMQLLSNDLGKLRVPDTGVLVEFRSESGFSKKPDPNLSNIKTVNIQYLMTKLYTSNNICLICSTISNFTYWKNVRVILSRSGSGYISRFRSGSDFPRLFDPNLLFLKSKCPLPNMWTYFFVLKVYSHIKI